jgi:tetratricopeptide (TPR) repeat protein
MNRPSPAQLLERAVAAFQAGRWHETESACRALAAAGRDGFEVRYLLGLVAERTGHVAQAVSLLSEAARLNPGHPETRFNLGVALARLGRFEEAVTAYDGAIALRAGFADAHFNRGVALGTLGRAGEALAAYERAVALAPADPQAHHNLGTTLAGLGRHDEALGAFDRALAIDPRYARAFASRAAAVFRLGRLDEALDSCDRAIATDPRAPEAWDCRALVLLELGRPAEALESAGRAIAIAPGEANAHYHRGNALRELARFEEAIAAYERAIALDPRHAAAHRNLADVLLLCGDFARGWEAFAGRWRLSSPGGARPDITAPPWLGEEGVEGRTLLLHGEMGMGDTLQFCRYATPVARLGARIILEAPAPLVPLLRTLEGPATVIARGEAIPPHDGHCPLMSLPFALRTDLATLPAAVPYLHADPVREAAWRSRLGPGSRRRIGLAWSGSAGLRNDRRSLSLANVLPLVGRGADWYSLQKDVPGRDKPLLATLADLRELGTAFADFADTAAALSQLDLVITVDTSVAHVAGALGKPVWILLPHVPHDWRWFREGERTPWYPTARLFRQPAPGDWDTVVREVAAAIDRLPAR